MTTPSYLGLDFGTSGARACVIAAHGEIEDMLKIDFGRLHGDDAAARWRESLFHLIGQIPTSLRKRLAGLAIDGTSATVLACSDDLQPLLAPLMYGDARATAEAEEIARKSGKDHVAASATSGLAKAMHLNQKINIGQRALFLNQTDWLTALLSGRPVSDSHNALKMGLDPATNRWPDWLESLLPARALPTPARPGEALTVIERVHARAFNLPSDCVVHAGTTDSIAAVLAAGVQKPGEAVTSLGTTLVLKLLSQHPVESGEYGIYSHWFGTLWLTGGASNTGGGVLRQYFSDVELRERSAQIDARCDSGLDYYPLKQAGERFPINDPELPARVMPQPADRNLFLHGLLEGVARIEALGYRRLAELGASPLTNVVSCGGGAGNVTFSRVRERLLGVPVQQAPVDEACYGTARLACFGPALFPAEQTT